MNIKFYSDELLTVIYVERHWDKIILKNQLSCLLSSFFQELHGNKFLELIQRISNVQNNQRKNAQVAAHS